MALLVNVNVNGKLQESMYVTVRSKMQKKIQVPVDPKDPEKGTETEWAARLELNLHTDKGGDPWVVQGEWPKIKVFRVKNANDLLYENYYVWLKTLPDLFITAIDT